MLDYSLVPFHTSTLFSLVYLWALCPALHQCWSATLKHNFRLFLLLFFYSFSSPGCRYLCFRVLLRVAFAETTFAVPGHHGNVCCERVSGFRFEEKLVFRYLLSSALLNYKCSVASHGNWANLHFTQKWVMLNTINKILCILTNLTLVS